MMRSLKVATKSVSPEVITEEARVLRVVGVSITLSTSRGELDARRAVSCLVAPEEDDLVVVAFGPSGAFVLAVLQREECATTRIEVEGDLEVRLSDGSFKVAATQGIDLVSSEEVAV